MGIGGGVAADVRPKVVGISWWFLFECCVSRTLTAICAAGFHPHSGWFCDEECDKGEDAGEDEDHDFFF